MKKITQANKELFIDAAKELFAKKGYLDTSINDIVEITGRSIGSFYRIFKTKLDIATEIYEDEIIGLIKKAMTAVEKSKDVDSFIDSLIEENIIAHSDNLCVQLQPFCAFTGHTENTLYDYAYRYRAAIKNKLKEFFPIASDDTLWLCATTIHALLSHEASWHAPIISSLSKRDLRFALLYIVKMCDETGLSIR